MLHIFDSHCVGVMQKIKEVGVLYNHRKQAADDRTLESLKFQIGDYLDVAM